MTYEQLSLHILLGFSSNFQCHPNDVRKISLHNHHKARQEGRFGMAFKRRGLEGASPRAHMDAPFDRKSLLVTSADIDTVDNQIHIRINTRVEVLKRRSPMYMKNIEGQQQTKCVPKEVASESSPTSIE